MQASATGQEGHHPQSRATRAHTENPQRQRHQDHARLRPHLPATEDRQAARHLQKGRLHRTLQEEAEVLHQATAEVHRAEAIAGEVRHPRAQATTEAVPHHQAAQVTAEAALHQEVQATAEEVLHQVTEDNTV